MHHDIYSTSSSSDETYACRGRFRSRVDEDSGSESESFFAPRSSLEECSALVVLSVGCVRPFVKLGC